MQVWRRDTQTGLRERAYEDIVSVHWGGNSFDKHRVWSYMNDLGIGVRWGPLMHGRSLPG